MKPMFLMLLLPLLACAQHAAQPSKEDNSDLRDASALFRIEDVKNGKVILLERSYHLRRFERQGESVRKMSSQEAQQLDRDFAARFIRVQYELPEMAGDCEITLRLNMKGEEQELCSKDEKKTQEISSFVDELEKRFKG
jgi:hypothetical protein